MARGPPGERAPFALGGKSGDKPGDAILNSTLATSRATPGIARGRRRGSAAPNPASGWYRFRYDGLNRQIAEISQPTYPTRTRTDYYYNTSWQVLQECKDSGLETEDTVATTLTFEYVWDPRYIDAPVCRDEDKSDGEGGDPDGDTTDPATGRITLRILVDRTSMEVFANDGKVSMNSCFLPDAGKSGLELFCDGGSPRILSMTVYELKSAWAEAGPSRSADE